jgi:hypothetical protein
MEVKEKHLDHIQAVITRHNSNSFMIKGWTITICTAIYALAGTWKEPILALVSFFPIIIFWLLDSFYLANERCFVSLYNAAINDYKITVKNKQLLKENQVKTDLGEGKFKIDPEKDVEIKSSVYSMNFMPFRAIERNNMKDAFGSTSIRWFYIMLMIFSIVLFVGLLFFNKPTTNEPLKISTTFATDSLVIKNETPQVIVNNIILNDSIIKRDTIKRNK